VRDVSKRFGLALTLTVFADLWLFGHPPGLGLALFALVLGGVTALHYRRRLRHAGPWLAVWLLLVASAAIEGAVTGIVLLVLLTWAILAMGSLGAPRSVLSGLVRGLTGGLRSFVRAPSDARRAALIGGRRVGEMDSPFWVYAFPAAVTLIFALLIVPANLLLSRWANRGMNSLREMILQVDIGRTLFWLVMFCGVYGLLRFQLGRRRFRDRARPARAVDGERRTQELKTCLITLVCVNILYLAANVTDGLYLWAGFELPEGLTYSEYAHQGSNRLIVAVVLAAAMVAVLFRRDSLQTTRKGARGLAYLLIAQNIVVLAGAGRRLMLYADAYGLTRFRVAVVVWLALVAVGFLLIGWKIRGNRPFRFLVETNAATTVLWLSLWSLANIDGIVADWNVDRFLRARPGETITLDAPYLLSLGPGALPALARLSKKAPAQSAFVLPRLRARVEEARLRQAQWEGWTYRRHVALREVDEILDD
jgi:hypothetical protein